MRRISLIIDKDFFSYTDTYINDHMKYVFYPSVAAVLVADSVLVCIFTFSPTSKERTR